MPTGKFQFQEQPVLIFNTDNDLKGNVVWFVNRLYNVRFLMLLKSNIYEFYQGCITGVGRLWFKRILVYAPLDLTLNSDWLFSWNQGGKNMKFQMFVFRIKMFIIAFYENIWSKLCKDTNFFTSSKLFRSSVYIYI